MRFAKYIDIMGLRVKLRKQVFSLVLDEISTALGNRPCQNEFDIFKILLRAKSDFTVQNTFVP